MTNGELIDLTRVVLKDIPKPHKWSDETIVMYLNEAQEKVSRETLAFVNADTELYVTAGEDMYVLDGDIQMVYRVKLVGSTLQLQASTDSWTPDSDQAGTPSRYALDTASMSLRLYPIPDEDGVAVMRVARYPTGISIDSLDTICEVPVRHQVALPDWAAYRCFTHDDADGRNDKAAELAKARFDGAVREFKHALYRLRTGDARRVSGNRVR